MVGWTHSHARRPKNDPLTDGFESTTALGISVVSRVPHTCHYPSDYFLICLAIAVDKRIAISENPVSLGRRPESSCISCGFQTWTDISVLSPLKSPTPAIRLSLSVFCIFRYFFLCSTCTVFCVFTIVPD